MAAVSKGLKDLFSSPVKSSGDLLAGGNGAPGFVQRLTQLEYRSA
jgi:hypothetical protein